jgi:hypothetical protein
VRRNSGSPEFTVEGATSAMLGMLPAAAGVVAFELYPQASVMGNYPLTPRRTNGILFA